MKLRTIIASLTLVSCLVQCGLVALLIAIWLSRFILCLCLCPGAGLFGPRSEQFIVRTLEILLFPIRQFLSPDSFGSGSLEVYVLLIPNSLIWGVGLGTVIYSLQWTAKRIRGARADNRESSQARF